MACAKSMTDVAFEIMSKKKRAIQFKKLWEEVSKVYGVRNDQVAQFYADMTLDSRFVSLKGNRWDLINRHKYEDSHVDISQIELDEDEPEEGEEDPDMINEKENY